MKRLSVALFVGLPLFAYFVWPTPWQTSTLSASDIQANQGIIGGVLNIGSDTVTAYRSNQFNGQQEARYGGQWHRIVCGTDACVPESDLSH